MVSLYRVRLVTHRVELENFICFKEHYSNSSGLAWRDAIPLLLSLLHKSQSLDIAIESRAFGAPGRRTYIDEIRPGTADWLVMAIATLYCGGLFVASIVNGWGAGLVGIVKLAADTNG